MFRKRRTNKTRTCWRLWLCCFLLLQNTRRNVKCSELSWLQKQRKSRTVPTVFRSVLRKPGWWKCQSLASCWWPANLDFCSKDEKLFPARCLPWFPPSATAAALIGIMTLNELNLLFKAEDLVFVRTSLSHSHTVAGGGHQMRISVSKAPHVNYLPTSGQSCSLSRLNKSPLLCASGNIIKAATFYSCKVF